MEIADTTCGVGFWRPSCLQRFATNRTFVVIYGLLGTVQAMSFIYFVATLTTLEKRFQMPSQTMGILMSGNEISQILLVLVLSYLGQGNRPVWIAWGVIISGISCYILALPHFIYGPGPAALALTAEHLNETIFNSTIPGTGNPFLCNPDRPDKTCSSVDIQSSLVPMILLFLSQFVLGIGTSLYFSLGQTYMDDNTKKTNTPLLLGIAMSLRTLGPALGFALGFLCLRIYVGPSLTPLINQRDPRWLGAWWLGWVILGTTMVVFGLLIGMFPKNLPKKQSKRKAKEVTEKPEHVYKKVPVDETNLHEGQDSLYNEFVEQEKNNSVDNVYLRPKKQSFGSSLKRILTNKLLMVNNFTSVFYIIGASGYINFFNKYTETQFNSSASSSNMVAGVATLISLVLGFLLSGWMISKFKPRASFLLLWNVGVGIFYMGGEILLMFLGCPETDLQATFNEDGLLNASAACNLGCGCDTVKYSPVCDPITQKTYFSACHAGCTGMNVTAGLFSEQRPPRPGTCYIWTGKWPLNGVGNIYTLAKALGSMCMSTFFNCGCIDDATALLTSGTCTGSCTSTLYLFMTVICLMQMVGCTGRITNILINYRSVRPQDKAMAQGLALMLISLFAFIPGPILYGKIIDNACLVWDNTCGSKGNCWLYNKTDFRIYLNSTAASFSLIAVLLDVVLWWLGKDLKLYEETATHNMSNKRRK